jgi:predicted kinase
MINVCRQCGLYRADKIIDPAGPTATCPECGFAHKFKQLPLLVVAGASGTGKTTVLHKLKDRLTDAVMLEMDILWRSEFNTPENQYRDFFETWLRMCKNISQSGRPVILFGAGAGVPDNLEGCVERRYLSEIHYLALTCSEAVLTKRLLARPEWRGTHAPAFIAEQHRFNNWFLDYQPENGAPQITRLDTAHQPLEQTIQEIEAWIRSRLP